MRLNSIERNFYGQAGNYFYYYSYYESECNLDIIP